MRIHDAAFYFIVFFLFGIVLAGLKNGMFFSILAAFFLTISFLIVNFKFPGGNFKRLAVLSTAVIIGFFYYFFYESYANSRADIIFGEKINFKGIVIDEPKSGNGQKLTIKLRPPMRGKILVNLPPYPEFEYGDLLILEGTIKKPFSEDYAEYLKKDGVFGIVDFPKTEINAKNQASKIKRALFKLKNANVAVFKKILPPEKAAFLSGIVFGERAEFSKEFKEAMTKSGTTHLVALSGYNITVIILAFGAAFKWFLNRKTAFWLTVAAITAFVLMTGAEASVVRAAIMGGIVLLAGKIGRVKSMRNAIAVAAFLMAIFNPKILPFDVGFQLSFMALLGIVYLSPAIKIFLKMKNGGGFLNWRENMLTTVSAQLAVIPILLVNFGNFSITSFLPNILILEAVPITMFFGFLVGAAGILFLPLAQILAWFAGLFLFYEIAVIKIFSEISVQIPTVGISAGIFGAVLYYAALALFIIRNAELKYKSRQKNLFPPAESPLR